MSGSGEELASLAPMRVRQDSVQSTVADFLARQASRERHRRLIEIDGSVSEMDAAIEFGPSTSGVDGEDAAHGEYDEALDRFMRNEIAYDEFMMMTGGVGLDEEAADYDDAADEDIDETVLNLQERRRKRGLGAEDKNDGIADEDVEMDEDNEMDDSRSSELFQDSFSRDALNATEQRKPVLLQSARLGAAANSEEIDEDRLLGIPLELRGESTSVPAEQPDRAVTVTKGFGGGGSSRARPNKIVDALLGQANVIFAKGQIKEALTMLLEVIRQEPRNPEPYRQVADIYHELNQPHKSLQYGLLAAHLNGRTPANQWSELGDLAYKLERIEEAAACYGRAMRIEPSNWRHYEKRISMLDIIGLRPLAMKTRLMAAQLIDHSAANVHFDWFQNLIKTVAEYYIQLNDEEKAILALEAFVLRSREFGRKADAQHNILVGMWMARKRFEDAAKSIFALCSGIVALDDKDNPALEIKFNNAGYSVTPFPPRRLTRFVVDDTLSTCLLARLIVCFIRLDRKDLVPTLIDKLLERDIADGEEFFYLDIGRAYQVMDSAPHAQKYIEFLLEKERFVLIPEVHYLYGQILLGRKKEEEAARSFERVLELQPSHVDARINLSSIQQRMGLTEEAFETLKDYDLDAGSSLPDERLLIRQADFLSGKKRIDQFVRCVRMLLAPHFFTVYQSNAVIRKRYAPGSTKIGIAMCNGMRTVAFNAVHGCSLEKFVKRLGAIAVSENRPTNMITAVQLHDYSFKLLEILMGQKRYIDALHVCCYAYLQPAICRNQKTLETFQNLMLFCSMKAHYWPLSFEYLRWFHTTSLNNHPVLMPADRDLLFTRIFNAMNYVFCHSQNVSYHRYVMRALTRLPGNIALQMISGNNSLITGAYRHALGEYLRVWFQVPDNPLVCLLIALTFTHMACKKDICSRHMVALRGLAFMNRYEKLRGPCQETFYNIARMFHQMNILPLAISFYEKCLQAEVPRISVLNEGADEEVIVIAECYDLRPLAAHNLATIYETSGNLVMARHLLQKYCVVE